MTRTKILATIGPSALLPKEKIEQLIDAGGQTHSVLISATEHTRNTKERYDTVRKLAKEKNFTYNHCC